MFDYHDFKRETEAALSHVGMQITKGVALRRMNPTQVRRASAKNMMTDDVWQYRTLAGSSIIVEIAYSWFMQKPLLGMTVFNVGKLADDAEEWDHTLSNCYNSASELVERLRELHEGGLERIAAKPVKPVRMWVEELTHFDPLYGAFAIWGEYPNGDRDLITHRQTREAADSYIAAGV